MIIPNVIRGGNAIPLGDNLFFMKGRKHKNGGIDIGKSLEVEGGEVMQTSPNDIKVFSAQKFLGGQSPADLVLSGANPDRVFAAQEQYKENNKINDDGSKKKAEKGIRKLVSTIKDAIVGDKTKSPVKGEDKMNFDNLKLTNDKGYDAKHLEAIYNGLIGRGFSKNQAITMVGTIAEESGGDVFAKSKDNKYTGLLQWEGSRYKIKYPDDRNKELKNQLDYIADTVLNPQARKDAGFNDDWTDGGKGSGYMSWKEAFSDFNDTTNVYNMTRGLNTGYVRPTGAISGNTGSIKNRMNAARQIAENNNITDLKYEPDKKSLGGMSKAKKQGFMDSLMKSISDLSQVRINNPAGIHLREIDDEVLRNQLNKEYNMANTLGTALPLIGGESLGAPYIAGTLIGLGNEMGQYFRDAKKNKDENKDKSHSTGVQKKAVGGRVKGKLGTTVIYNDGTQHNTNDEDYDSTQVNAEKTDIYHGQRKLNTQHWLSTGIGAAGKIAAGITGSIINNATNRKYLSQMEGLIGKMKAYDIPLTKLKTHFNINPQLAEVENALRIGKKDIDANTASGQVALARKRAATLNATLQKNKLHGQKENIETELINKDRLQQAQTISENIRNHQNIANEKLKLLSNIVDKRAENATATTQNIVGSVVGGVDSLINGMNQYEQMLVGLAKSPDGANALYGQYGKNTKWRKKAGIKTT